MAVALFIGFLVHLGDAVPLAPEVAPWLPMSLPARQSLERILSLLPVMFATVAIGTRAGLATLAVTGAILLARVLMGPAVLHYAAFESGGAVLVGGLFILWMESQRRRADLASAFTRGVLAAQEEERKRVARELHDETAQSLLMISRGLETLGAVSPPGKPNSVGEEASKLRQVADDTLAGVRRMAQELRPPILEHLGLVPALEWLAEQHSGGGMKAVARVQPGLPPFTPEAQWAVFRIAQEALRNAQRHAGATEAAVDLRLQGQRVQLTISDNGRGFIAGDAGQLALQGKLGLAGMRERAQAIGGTFAVSSAQGKGTMVSAEFAAAGMVAPEP